MILLKKLKICVLCGGPSLERGVSLNSARSVCDHLQSDDTSVFPVYFDHFKNAYEISQAQLYSNTPSDFDFKLHQTARPLSKTALKDFLKSVDIVFPAMHGSFGEDGGIQKILEQYKVNYIGSDAKACKKCFDKYNANEFIKRQGFFTIPSIALKSHLKNHKQELNKFFIQNNLKRAVVKPATGGSSIAVFSVNNVSEALEKTRYIFSKKIDTKVVIEPFCEGIEFTVIVLQNRFGLPVAILPTEIEIDYRENQIFDYRKKYLASNQVKYHCPPRFEDEVVEKIQIQAEQIFQLFGMRNFARFDGWILKDGNIWFSDFNPVSGMEQNSFLFQQSAQVGMSHDDLLRYVIENALHRDSCFVIRGSSELRNTNHESRTKINVLFGGSTAERQVSVMSGTNVWLKLRKSKKYVPEPYLLSCDNKTVWKLPYACNLQHTAEEIEDMCRNAQKSEKRLLSLRRRVLEKLGLDVKNCSEKIFLPQKMTLKEFIKKSKNVFIALHGGIGEDGTLQKILEKKGIKYNGSNSQASTLCMDKFATAKALENLEDEGIFTAKKVLKKSSDFKKFTKKDFELFWRKLHRDLGSKTIIVKPKGDGCSAGIVRLFTAQDLKNYVKEALRETHFIKPGTFSNHNGIIEMPTEKMKELMFEEFIETDRASVIKGKLKWQKKSGWIEITVAVLGKGKNLKSLNPSFSVAEGNILSLEEKFQGGTGINITPPPQSFVKKQAIDLTKKRIERVARILNLSGYARIDAFMHIKTGEIIVIEVNTMPALTPSTVIYHQALAEKEPMYPKEFLEKICNNFTL